MTPRPGFDAFWTSRGKGYVTVANRLATSHAAAVIAYASARLGLTPNQVTLLSFLCGAGCFLLALGLPVDRPVLSVVVIVIAAELTLVLDCADGLLARVTGQATPSGNLLDHTLDIASQSCALSAIFVYAYRSGLALEDLAIANAALIVGFLFLVARATRHVAIHLSESALDPRSAASLSQGNGLTSFLTNLLEYQASMVAALAYLVSPLACLALFALQAVMCAAAVTRRLVRVLALERA